MNFCQFCPCSLGGIYNCSTWITVVNFLIVQETDRNHKLGYDMKVTHCIAPSRTLFSGRGQMRRPGFIFSYAPFIGSGGEKSHIKA